MSVINTGDKLIEYINKISGGKPNEKDKQELVSEVSETEDKSKKD